MSGDDARGSDADGVRADGPESDEETAGAPTDESADGADAPTDEAAEGWDAPADDPDDGGWRFALDEVGEEAGPPPMEPESPRRENVLFVLVGVALTVVLLVGAV